MLNQQLKSKFSKRCSKRCRSLIGITSSIVFFLALLFVFNFLPRMTTQDGFSIKSARSYTLNEELLIDADMQLIFTPEVAEALENGIPLIIVVEVQLFRERFLWRNNMIKESQRLFELRYHPLTNIHEVTSMASGQRYSFNSRQEAMSVLGMIRGAHLINKNSLSMGSQYKIQIRTFLDINYLPLALRQVASLSSSWYLRSPWYLWDVDTSPVMTPGIEKTL